MMIRSGHAVLDIEARAWVVPRIEIPLAVPQVCEYLSDWYPQLFYKLMKPTVSPHMPLSLITLIKVRYTPAAVLILHPFDILQVTLRGFNERLSGVLRKLDCSNKLSRL